MLRMHFLFPYIYCHTSFKPFLNRSKGSFFLPLGFLNVSVKLASTITPFTNITFPSIKCWFIIVSKLSNAFAFAKHTLKRRNTLLSGTYSSIDNKQNLLNDILSFICSSTISSLKPYQVCNNNILKSIKPE